MKTTVLKSSQIKRKWHKIDLKDQILGRVATQIAFHLMGKDKPLTSPNLDNGDFVIAINADAIKVTGRKLDQKLYQRHSGYPGGFKEIVLKELMLKDSRKVIEHAVKGMLPKNKLRRPRMRRLKVYKDSNHLYKDQIKGSSSDSGSQSKKNKDRSPASGRMDSPGVRSVKEVTKKK